MPCIRRISPSVASCTTRPCRGRKIPIDSRFSTRSGGHSRSAGLFPPQDRLAFHEAVLREILKERVVSSRSRHNTRGVKRKMSSYPLRLRTRGWPRRRPVALHIRIIK